MLQDKNAMKCFIILGLLILTINLFGQESNETLVIAKIGHEQKTGDNVTDTTKSITYKMKYPDMARRKGIQGTVKIKTTFDSECNIVKREIIKSIGYGCDEEALRALTHLEKTIKQTKKNNCKDGEEVTYPFEFRLD